jgi:mRNA-degrading endonuclease toxin of MazEF toxin-antitoxin module
MNTPPDADTEELTRFLHRFADLMSTGTNADNLLRAAKLLESQVDLARKSTEQLRAEQVRSKDSLELCKLLEDKIAMLEGEILDLTASLNQRQSEFSDALIAAANERDQQTSRAEQAEARLAAIEASLSRNAARSETHIVVPITTLRLAEAQFKSLARAFEQSGNIVSQVMCEASASALDRAALEAEAPVSTDRPKHAAA